MDHIEPREPSDCWRHIHPYRELHDAGSGRIGGRGVGPYSTFQGLGGGSHRGHRSCTRRDAPQWAVGWAPNKSDADAGDVASGLVSEDACARRQFRC